MRLLNLGETQRGSFPNTCLPLGEFHQGAGKKSKTQGAVFKILQGDGEAGKALWDRASGHCKYRPG